MSGRNYNILCDSGTDCVLTVSSSVPATVMLQECIADSAYFTAVQYPHFMWSFFHEEPFFLARTDPEQYPLWTWKRDSRKFVWTRRDVLSNVLRARSRLANAKREALEVMLLHLSVARYGLQKGLPMQETVYWGKKKDASAFKEAGYDDTLIMNFPYVLQYADVAGISFKQAADDILFKAKLDSDILLKTELLRLQFFRRIKAAIQPEEVKAILEDFHRNSYRSVVLVS